MLAKKKKRTFSRGQNGEKVRVWEVGIWEKREEEKKKVNPLVAFRGDGLDEAVS